MWEKELSVSEDESAMEGRNDKQVQKKMREETREGGNIEIG